jgi:hypothetical protein
LHWNEATALGITMGEPWHEVRAARQRLDLANAANGAALRCRSHQKL